MQQRIAQHDAINWLCPVNWSHPLNRGLVAWYLAMPNQPGWKSSQWLDLCDPVSGNHSQLTNMTPSTAWQASSRPGGWGAISVAGTGNQHVAVPDSDYNIASGYTLACWHKGAASGSAQALIGRDDSTGERFWQFRRESSGVAGFIRFSAAGSVVTNITGSTALTGNVWRRVLATFTGSGSAIYINGKLESSDSVTTANRDGTGTAPAIGRRSAEQADDEPLTGQVDDVRFWNRGLSAGQAQADFNLSRQHYPGLLNRVQLPYYAPQVGGFIDNTSPILRHIMGAAL